ncbi:MAG: acylneuraminate cytidylyltransferase family protein [Desulfobacterales bacterium]|nr:acylneuraminate cytidylyltransferase family protein [Desulfobacterales bacterium]
MKIVAMVPARQGSKGLTGKNIAPLAGQPLLQYPIAAARGCPAIRTVYLNSDSRDYLNIGAAVGARPFPRRASLAGDTVSMGAVVVDFIKTLQKSDEPCDAVIVLYPAYPLRTADHLSAILEAFINAGGDKPLIGIKPPAAHPYLCYTRQPDGTLDSLLGVDTDRYFRRQQYPEYFELTHWACVVPVSAVDRINAQCLSADTQSFQVPIEVPIVNIDTQADLDWAEYLLKSKRVPGDYGC